MRKFAGILIGVLVLVLAIFLFYRYYYVFGEGVKSGELNYLVKKGNIFKTYEGKLIQSGLRPGSKGSIQSYEFVFSVEDEDIAKSLMNNSGKFLDLHYKEYHGTLPWRGFSKYIVDSIYAIRSTPDGKNLLIQ